MLVPEKYKNLKETYVETNFFFRIRYYVDLTKKTKTYNNFSTNELSLHIYLNSANFKVTCEK